MEDDDKEVFLLLSLLLQYPESFPPKIASFRQMASELKSSVIQNHVYAFLHYVENNPWEQLTQQYVATFDFSEQSNMDLTSLLYPDDRKRGPLLATLKGIYQQAGLDMNSRELPDYLPMILEFLSVSDQAASKEVLGIVRPGMEKLCQQLVKDNNPYRGVLAACLLVTVGTMSPEGGVS